MDKINMKNGSVIFFVVGDGGNFQGIDDSPLSMCQGTSSDKDIERIKSIGSSAEIKRRIMLRRKE